MTLPFEQNVPSWYQRSVARTTCDRRVRMKGEGTFETSRDHVSSDLKEISVDFRKMRRRVPDSRCTFAIRLYFLPMIAVVERDEHDTKEKKKKKKNRTNEKNERKLTRIKIGRK